MIKLIFACITTFLLTNAAGQSLNVYVKDTIYKPEPIVYTKTDSTEGTISANYTNFPNQLAFSANYYYGKRTGFVRYYYPSGKLMKTQVFQKGMKNGEFTLYNEAGEIVTKGVYYNNIKDGFWIYRNYKFMGKFKNGLKHGKWTFINPSGDKQRYFYKNGVLKKSKKPTLLPVIPKYILKDGVVSTAP